ncbi:MAG: hypothetical protein QW275_03650, partial [Candidatus Anstonellaceae archaeon]
RSGAFLFNLPDYSKWIEEPYETAKKHAASFLLLFCIILAFWIRIQTYSPIYSELDPYFYVYGASQILQEGLIPFRDDTAWYPEVETTHRGHELKSYIEAQWYAVYTLDGAYNNHLLYTIACWLPPISGALAAFGAYLAVASVFGRKYGLLAAFLMCFLPISIFKTSAGVNEVAPIGLMTIFLFLGTYSNAISKKDKEAAVFAAIAAFATVTASNYAPLIAIPLGLFLILQSLDYFLRMKTSNHLLQYSAFAIAGLFIGLIMKFTSLFGFPSGLVVAFSGSSLLALAGFAFALGLHYSNSKLHMGKRKRLALFAIFSLAVLIFLLATPPTQFPKTVVASYLGAAQFNVPLDRTIAEQNEAGARFDGEAGFIALVPKSHISQSSEIGAIVLNAVYSFLGIIADVCTYAGNLFLKIMDFFFNTLFGTKISTGQKESSLLFVFLGIFFFGSIIWQFARKGEARELPSVLLLILLFASPVLYVGLNKVKYTIFTGVMMVLAASVALGLLEALFRKIAKNKEKAVSHVFLVIIILMIFGQMTISNGYLVPVLLKSFETRYQDDPIGSMPKMAALCEKLRQKGYYDAEICAAGYDANFSEDLNRQFSYKICIASQLSVDEILPGSKAEQERSLQARIGASYRCNRLADYWIESMEWISKNLDADDRLTSWWDYGHWTNFLGERKTVLRNEHASLEMIGRIAYVFLRGTPQELAEAMKHYGSKHVLFDVELIGGMNGQFGGKYGALNYLSCAYMNRTNVNNSPGTSDCEFEQSPERIVIPQVASSQFVCTISESQQLKGVYAYKLDKINSIDSPAYCVGEVRIKTGEKITGIYYLDKKDENGDLKLAKGFLRPLGEEGGATYAEVVYNNLPVWPGPNGTWVGGMEDASTKFYTSNLYRGMFLKDLPGFELVFETKKGEVKIYRRIE